MKKIYIPLLSLFIFNFNILNAEYLLKQKINTIDISSQEQQINPGLIDSSISLYLDARNSDSYSGSGSLWKDLSGNGNDATLKSNVVYDLSSGSFSFNGGTEGYAYNTNSNNLPLGNSSRTISTWIKPHNNNVSYFNLGKLYSSYQMYVLLNYYYNGYNYIYTDARNSANNITVDNSSKPIPNQWNHIVFGNNGQNWFYYLNGELKANGTWSVTLNTYGNGYDIGRRSDSSSGTLSNISVIKIYNRALNSTEISSDFNNTKSYFGL